MKVFNVYIIAIVSSVIFVALEEYRGHEIDWAAFGVCITALIAIFQLRENGAQKTKDRELETKREVILDGVRGMSLASQAFGALSDLAIPTRDSSRLFQTATSQVTVSASVASLATARAGKEFMDTIGPRFIKALRMRMKIDNVNDVDEETFRQAHLEIVTYILENTIDVSKAMLRAIASVRTDVGIALETESEFLDAVYPNEELLRSVIDEVLDLRPAVA